MIINRTYGGHILRIAIGTSLLVIILVLSFVGVSEASTNAVVTANPIWTDTGLIINTGDTISITASGNWSSGSGPIGPNGGDTTCCDWDLFLANPPALHGELTAFVGSDPYQGQWGNRTFFPQPAGKGYWAIGSNGSFISDRNGKLWLGINDDAVSKTIEDNSGSVTALINTVTAPTPTTPTVSIIASPDTHDINVSTNFTFTANPVGSWGNNISYSWATAYEKCSTTASERTGQSITESLDVACGNATISVTAGDEKNNTANGIYLVTIHENATPTPTTPSPTPGWYRNGAGTILYEDNTGLKIAWQNSYVYPYPEKDPLYWYAEVVYSNNGSQPITITCSGKTDPSLAKENMRGTVNAGIVAAEETFCSRNPTFTRSLNPGETHKSWAIFHNVPKGGEVSLEWSPSYGSSPWVNPWYSPFNAPLPAECPPELVTRGTCKPATLTPTVVLIPEEGKVGDGVLGIGRGWPPLQRVDIYWDKSNEGILDATTNINGSFWAAFKVPEGAISGNYSIQFIAQVTEPLSAIVVNKEFQVITPTETPKPNLKAPVIPIPSFLGGKGDWAGYIDHAFGESLVSKSIEYTRVDGSWKVPKVDCQPSASPNALDIWVGLGGFSAGSLEQIGIRIACNAGTSPGVAITPFYEIVPETPRYPEMTINPGDVITATAEYLGTKSSTNTCKADASLGSPGGEGMYRFSLVNKVTGASFISDPICGSNNPSARSSADWIVEGHLNKGPLLNFDRVDFINTRSNNGNIGAGWIGKISIYTNEIPPKLLAFPSALDSSGTTFTVYWQK